MNNQEPPSFEFPQISKHEVYESQSGNIVIAELDSDGPDQHIIMPIWRAREVLSALEDLMNYIHDRENPPF